MKASYIKHNLIFKKQAGTSRGVLLEKPSWFLILDSNGKRGIGECSILPKLSLEKNTDLSPVFDSICNDILLGKEYLINKWQHYPAVKFAIEMAFCDLEFGEEKQFYDTPFYSQQKGIQTNGLIWMGSKTEMLTQVDEKIAQGFSCVKLKIGAINWEDELDILKHIRSKYDKHSIELRVDANGAFDPQEAIHKLDELAKLDIHSIEQPIKAEQWDKMADLCQNTPLPIALDEELIPVLDNQRRFEMLNHIKPQYIILKPSLIGGFSDSEYWINIANQLNIGWWATSALESNIGLNAIAQWTSKMETTMPQGLGTGSLFTNNISSPLKIIGDKLVYTGTDWQNFNV